MKQKVNKNKKQNKCRCLPVEIKAYSQFLQVMLKKTFCFVLWFSTLLCDAEWDWRELDLFLDMGKMELALLCTDL